MHFVLLQNVTFPFGKEFTRLTLARVLTAMGNVEEIIVNVDAGMASLCFADSVDAQEALLTLDGSVLFGAVLSATVSQPLSCGIDGYFISLSPTKRLLVKNAPYLSVFVQLRHMKGVHNITSTSLNCCTVDVSNDEVAEEVRTLLTRHRNRWQNTTTVLYLRPMVL